MELKEFIKKTITQCLNEQLILKNGYPLFYHGATDVDLNGKTGIHIGTKLAATEALEAKIGVPAEGEWDGTREYGKTLLAGKKRLKELDYSLGYDPIMNFNATKDVPENNYYPYQRKKKAVFFSTDTIIPLDVKPIVFRVLIIGDMMNTYDSPYTDEMANKLIPNKIKNKGCYYINIWEDEGSISAVVPNASFLKIL